MAERYTQRLKDGIGDLLIDKDISIGRIGNRERWYKSPVSDEEYDGDSLYAKMKGEDYQLVDGVDVEDVGIFSVYNNTFRRVKIGEDPGFMVAYAKSRELKKPNDKHFWLNLLIGNIAKDELKKENINYQLLSNMIIMPVLPEISVNDQDQRLAVTQRLVYPHSMSFEKEERNDVNNWGVDLSKFGISLESIAKEGLNPDRVRSYIKSIGPALGCDYTYDPIFPKTRKDVCAVRHMAENGSTFGYDTIYLVWNDKEGKMKTQEITNSRTTKDYLDVKDILDEKDKIIIDLGNSKREINKKDLGLE